jgi:hypothetical protein
MKAGYSEINTLTGQIKDLSFYLNDGIKEFIAIELNVDKAKKVQISRNIDNTRNIIYLILITPGIVIFFRAYFFQN